MIFVNFFKSIFMNSFFLSIVTTIIVWISIKEDIGSRDWLWFQRSGSIIALVGGLMTYRSIIRDGIKGVNSGGAQIFKAQVMGTNDDGTVRVKYDEETLQYFAQDKLDKIAGFIGALFITFGTVIWGYGDLLGRYF